MEPDYEKLYKEMEIKYYQAMGALGYPVPSEIPEGNMRCGLCEAKVMEIVRLKEESKTLWTVVKHAVTRN